MLESTLSSGESEGDELQYLAFHSHYHISQLENLNILEPVTKHTLTLLTDSCFIRILVYGCGPLTLQG